MQKVYLKIKDQIMNKDYTSVEQSQKLIKLGIDKTTSDMHYDKHPLENYYSPIPIIGKYSEIHDQLPCWSLSALLEILPPGKILLHDKGGLGYKCICNNIDTDFHDNPVDACFEMIVELNELKMLQL